MSSFTEPLSICPVPGNGKWATTRDLTYEIGNKGSGLAITVPAGFETDLASVPRLLWPIFAPHDPRYAAAAVIHDYLYRWKGFDRVVADAILYEGMRLLGVPLWKSLLMYVSVRIWNSTRSGPLARLAA